VEAYVVELEAHHGRGMVGVAGVETSGSTVTDVYGDFVNIKNLSTVQTSDVDVP
jgi:hypothetical protein